MGRSVRCVAGFLITQEILRAAPKKKIIKAIRDGDGEPWAPEFTSDAQEYIDWNELMEDIALFLKQNGATVVIEWPGSFVGHRCLLVPEEAQTQFIKDFDSNDPSIELSDIKKRKPELNKISKALKLLGIESRLVIEASYYC